MGLMSGTITFSHVLSVSMLHLGQGRDTFFVPSYLFIKIQIENND